MFIEFRRLPKADLRTERDDGQKKRIKEIFAGIDEAPGHKLSNNIRMSGFTRTRLFERPDARIKFPKQSLSCAPRGAALHGKIGRPFSNLFYTRRSRFNELQCLNILLPPLL